MTFTATSAACSNTPCSHPDPVGAGALSRISRSCGVDGVLKDNKTATEIMNGNIPDFPARVMGCKGNEKVGGSEVVSDRETGEKTWLFRQNRFDAVFFGLRHKSATTESLMAKRKNRRSVTSSCGSVVNKWSTGQDRISATLFEGRISSPHHFFDFFSHCETSPSQTFSA